MGMVMSLVPLTPYARMVTALAGMERAGQAAELRKLALYLEMAGPSLKVASRFVSATASRIERETGRLGGPELGMIAGLEGPVTAAIPAEDLGRELAELVTGGEGTGPAAPLGVEALFRSPADAVVAVEGSSVNEGAPVLRYLTAEFSAGRSGGQNF